MSTLPETKVLALFDFDGTLTHKDSLFAVIKFIVGKRKFYLGLPALAPYIFLYLIKRMPNWKLKERILTGFLAGMTESEFDAKCEQFVKQVLPHLLRGKALAKIQELKKKGVVIFVVTASAERWVLPWCQQMGIGCIGTNLEVINGRITGKIAGTNCNGIEKVNRIKTTIDLSKYEEILAYGDTPNDLPMLKLATLAYYRTFH